MERRDWVCKKQSVVKHQILTLRYNSLINFSFLRQYWKAFMVITVVVRIKLSSASSLATPCVVYAAHCSARPFNSASSPGNLAEIRASTKESNSRSCSPVLPSSCLPKPITSSSDKCLRRERTICSRWFRFGARHTTASPSFKRVRTHRINPTSRTDFPAPHTARIGIKGAAWSPIASASSRCCLSNVIPKPGNSSILFAVMPKNKLLQGSWSGGSTPSSVNNGAWTAVWT